MFGDLPPPMRRRWALGRLAGLLLVIWASREVVDWAALWVLVREHVSRMQQDIAKDLADLATARVHSH